MPCGACCCEPVRLFIAAEPSNAVRRAAAECIESVKAAISAHAFARNFRWVPEKNLHITIWFLGEVRDERADAVLNALRPPLAASSIPLAIRGFGTFPPSGSPRVLWMGVIDGLPQLASANAELGGRLAPFGFVSEAAAGRPYSAHLTVARVKEPVRAADRVLLRNALSSVSADAGRCRVDALTLFRSRTSPKGPAYEPLLRVPLS